MRAPSPTSLRLFPLPVPALAPAPALAHGDPKPFERFRIWTWLVRLRSPRGRRALPLDQEINPGVQRVAIPEDAHAYPDGSQSTFTSKQRGAHAAVAGRFALAHKSWRVVKFTLLSARH